MNLEQFVGPWLQQFYIYIRNNMPLNLLLTNSVDSGAFI